MKSEEKTDCPMCGKRHDCQVMKRVPVFFAPPTHFLMGCMMFSKADSLNPVALSKGWFQALVKPSAKQPVCPTCWRMAILASIAMYILIAGGITAVIIGE